MAFFKKLVASCAIVATFMMAAQAQNIINAQAGSSQKYNGIDHVCGDTNKIGEKEHYTWDYTYLCLVFFLEGKGLRKVLFKPRVDKFEVLEIQGLHDIFKSQLDAKVWALSNGIYSRETHFKLNDGVAQVLNLVVTLKDGKIVGLNWKNGCVPRTCEFEDCHEKRYTAVAPAHEFAKEKVEMEKNCFIRTCHGQSSKKAPHCDTKVYVTWEGNDIENRYCVSDNFRITNLMQHSIQSYFDSAINVSPDIVEKGV